LRSLLVMLMLASSATQAAGDAERGRAIAESRTQGLCVLCHALPGLPTVQAGTIGPNLAGVGVRLSVDDLRARLVAPDRFNPETVMPSYARSDGFERVANARRGQALLDAQQIDDVAAYLATLR
jgi:L-cysteine S-thiosulfotransferase